MASNRYNDPTIEVEAVKVLPGEYFTTTSNIVLLTALGAYISVCVRDRDNNIIGINHFMPPSG